MFFPLSLLALTLIRETLVKGGHRGRHRDGRARGGTSYRPMLAGLVATGLIAACLVAPVLPLAMPTAEARRKRARRPQPRPEVRPPHVLVLRSTADAETSELCDLVPEARDAGRVLLRLRHPAGSPPPLAVLSPGGRQVAFVVAHATQAAPTVPAPASVPGPATGPAVAAATLGRLLIHTLGEAQARQPQPPQLLLKSLDENVLYQRPRFLRDGVGLAYVRLAAMGTAASAATSAAAATSSASAPAPAGATTAGSATPTQGPETAERDLEVVVVSATGKRVVARERARLLRIAGEGKAGLGLVYVLEGKGASLVRGVGLDGTTPPRTLHALGRRQLGEIDLSSDGGRLLVAMTETAPPAAHLLAELALPGGSLRVLHAAARPEFVPRYLGPRGDIVYAAPGQIDLRVVDGFGHEHAPVQPELDAIHLPVVASPGGEFVALRAELRPAPRFFVASLASAKLYAFPRSVTCVVGFAAGKAESGTLGAAGRGGGGHGQPGVDTDGGTQPGAGGATEDPVEDTTEAEVDAEMP